MNTVLLRRFLEVYPFQPATAVWRASEIAALSTVSFPRGLGLDLGCGDGRLTRVVADLAGPMRLVGLDIDPAETALAEAEHFYERVHTASGASIEEPDATFDFVVSVSVLEHIPDLEPVLREVARVLKPGASFIVTVPGPGFHDCLRGPLLPGMSRETYLEGLDRRVAHLRYWSTAEWRAALDRAQLHLIEARPIMSVAVIRRWETISRLTAGILHVLSRRKAPIEIQRSLGMRRAHARMPRAVAGALSSVLSVGVTDQAPSTELQSGCLLLVAQRA